MIALKKSEKKLRDLVIIFIQSLSSTYIAMLHYSIVSFEPVVFGEIWASDGFQSGPRKYVVGKWDPLV